MKKEEKILKHSIVAIDKETGEQRQFIFYGDWYNESMALIVEEVYRPMTEGEKEIAKGLDDFFCKTDYGKGEKT